MTNTLNARTILADPSMRELLKANNYIAVRDLTVRILVQLTLMLVVYLLFLSEKFILGIVFFYILAIWHSFWGYAGIGHELMHGSVFSNKKLNAIIYYISSALVWSNPVFFRASHLYHHGKTFADDDIETNSVQQWGVVDIFFYLTIDIPFMFRRIFYTLVNSSGFKCKKSGGVKCQRISRSHQFAAIIILLTQVAINIVIYNITDVILYNVLWTLLPFTGQFFNRFLAQSQHIGLGLYRDQGALKHSRTIRIPKLFEFLYAGMNYHAEHHLIPSIPYYNLEKISVHLALSHGHQILDWRDFYFNHFFNLLKTNKIRKWR